jgi:hypothetical protein
LRPARDGGGAAQVLDAAVGAGADEDAFDRHLVERRPDGQAHVVQRARHRLAPLRVRRVVRVGHAAGDGQRVFRAVAHVTIGATAAASSDTSRSNAAPSSLGSARQPGLTRSHSAPFGAYSRPAR